MATTSPSTFGALLRRHRLAAGLTQEGLAERAGLSARGVQNIERGVNLTPRAETIRLLAEALGLDAGARAGLIAAAHPELTTPPAQAVAPLPPSLPIPPTALIGREGEVASASALLWRPERADGSRLLTLTGPGGVGKTRLALAIAAALAGEFADGVAWVELAPLHDPDLVAAAIAGVMGVREQGGRPLAGALAAALAARRLLLVLDNLEHLLPAAPLVADLLAAAPRLAVLATSRARLRLRGEREFPVGPLAVPAASSSGPSSLAGLTESAAVRLFVERAAEARPGFVLVPDDAAAVAEICRRLDGLPLAIELAAAWIKLLPPAELLARLERRLPLLTGGPRDAPARQRTMRDAITWSHDLLTTDEQTLFRRLAIFAGGFTIDAAEVIAGAWISPAGGGQSSRSVLDLIAALVDESLLRPIEQTSGDPRFAMLETIHEDALDRLAASGESEAVGRLHAFHYVALAERAEPELTGPEQGVWLDLLETEHANLRAALEWSLTHGEAALALRFVGALWHFWQVRGHVGEGRAWAEAALAGGAEESTVERARALRAAGLLAEYHGDYERAVARHEAAASIWRALGDDRNLARTLDHLGNCAHDRGDFARADDLHEQAMALARAAGDTRAVANAQGNLGIMALHRGDLPSARWRLEDALTLFQSIGHAHGVGVALSNLAVVALREGDLARSVALQEESLALWQELGDQDEIATSLVNLGEALGLAGDREQAAANLEEGRRRFAELGNTRNTAIALANLGTLAGGPADGPRAAALFAAGLALSDDVDDKLNIAACLEGLAGAAARQGQEPRAARLLGVAATLREAIGAPVAAHLRAGHDQIVATARAGIDADAFRLAWEAGRRLPLDQAVAEALALADDLA